MHLFTDLDSLFEVIIKKLQKKRELKISDELKGEINNKSFRSVTATRKNNPRALFGAVREVTVTILGESDDFLV